MQVLPKDWPGARLRFPMREFARALGVDCAHCHVGESGNKPEAEKYYKKSLELDPSNQNAKDMLKKLQE